MDHRRNVSRRTPSDSKQTDLAYGTIGKRTSFFSAVFLLLNSLQMQGKISSSYFGNKYLIVKAFARIHRDQLRIVPDVSSWHYYCLRIRNCPEIFMGGFQTYFSQCLRIARAGA